MHKIIKMYKNIHIQLQCNRTDFMIELNEKTLTSICRVLFTGLFYTDFVQFDLIRESSVLNVSAIGA